LALRAETGLFESIRNGDLATMRALLRSGVDPNSRNYVGATPLMYAAGFASPEYIALLLDSGADVNATSKAGTTALMWATRDTTNVRLLLEREADVNAKAKDGITALVTAAIRGNVDAMRLLIARGADVKGSAGELLRSAYSHENPGVRQVLAEAGVEPKNLKALGAPVFRGSLENPAMIGKLLEAGADPNAGVLLVTVKFPVLGLISFQSSAEAVRTLIEHGADPNRPDTRQRTPLMMAVSRTVPDTAMVRLLITKTADVNSRDDTGRTALDWALTQGETEAARMLREAGGKELAQPAAAPGAVEQSRKPRAAVENALDALLPASISSFERWKCVSCHNQSLPAIAAKVAGDHGIPVHSPVGGMSEKAPTGGLAITEEDRMLGRGLPNGYQMLALAERGAPANFATDTIVHWLAQVQRADGGWRESDLRPPLASGTIHPTALAIRALSVYAPPLMRHDINARIARARDYLLRATPADTQDEVFKLLGLVWSQAPDVEISRQRQRLLQLQRDNGGWSQLRTMSPDAFATGEALYALHCTGLATSSRAYKKGAEYLLRTQLTDGTWFVRSRAFGFQPYVETGFPHGVDQFISAAATSWAAIALAYTL
jgi:ankyrin repeat protein